MHAIIDLFLQFPKKRMNLNFMRQTTNLGNYESMTEMLVNISQPIFIVRKFKTKFQLKTVPIKYRL